MFQKILCWLGYHDWSRPWDRYDLTDELAMVVISTKVCFACPARDVSTRRTA